MIGRRLRFPGEVGIQQGGPVASYGSPTCARRKFWLLPGAPGTWGGLSRVARLIAFRCRQDLQARKPRKALRARCAQRPAAASVGAKRRNLLAVQELPCASASFIAVWAATSTYMAALEGRLAGYPGRLIQRSVQVAQVPSDETRQPID